MVITITCPSCTSSFPVDPAKIPEGGVSARCTQCNNVFRVEKPTEEAPPPLPSFDEPAPPPPPEPVAVEPEPVVVPDPEPVAIEPDPEPSFAAPEPMAAPDPTPADDPFAQPAPFEDPAAAAPPPMPEAPPPPLPEMPPAPDPVPEAPAVAEPAPAAAEPAAPVQGFTLGKRDPTDKAKRLARVLVSDMVMYNADRHQSALAAGTLVQDFEEEIDKSWKEYVEQVGQDMAEGPGRGFWTDALNDILAKGQNVF